MRSLTLDSLGDGESRLLLAIGNEKANAFWEKGLELQKGWKKPDPSVDRKVREGYIKSKYLWKGFLAYSESDGKTEAERVENFSQSLYKSAKKGDVLKMSEALAFGGSVDWMDAQDNNKTALQACVLIPKGPDKENWNAIECAELLYQHGAKLGSQLLDFAIEHKAEQEMIDYLWTRLPEADRKERLSLQLYKAAEEGDMRQLADLLAEGASVNWSNPNDDGKTALHACVLRKRAAEEGVKWKAIECVELLLTNGAQLDALDNDGHNVMDCAVVGNAEREMIEFLTTKLS